jgi:hypothetical protein
VNWAKIKPVFNQIYRDVFEQEEVDGLIAFYQSSAGKAYLTKMPQVIQKSTTLGQSQLQNIMPLAKARWTRHLLTPASTSNARYGRHSRNTCGPRRRYSARKRWSPASLRNRKSSSR